MEAQEDDASSNGAEIPPIRANKFGPLLVSFLSFFSQEQLENLDVGKMDSATLALLATLVKELIQCVSESIIQPVFQQNINTSSRALQKSIQASMGSSISKALSECFCLDDAKDSESCEKLTELISKEVAETVNFELSQEKVRYAKRMQSSSITDFQLMMDYCARLLTSGFAKLKSVCDLSNRLNTKGGMSVTEATEACQLGQPPPPQEESSQSSPVQRVMSIIERCASHITLDGVKPEDADSPPACSDAAMHDIAKSLVEDMSQSEEKDVLALSNEEHRNKLRTLFTKRFVRQYVPHMLAQLKKRFKRVCEKSSITKTTFKKMSCSEAEGESSSETAVTCADRLVEVMLPEAAAPPTATDQKQKLHKRLIALCKELSHSLFKHVMSQQAFCVPAHKPDDVQLAQLDPVHRLHAMSFDEVMYFNRLVGIFTKTVASSLETCALSNILHVFKGNQAAQPADALNKDIKHHAGKSAADGPQAAPHTDSKASDCECIELVAAMLKGLLRQIEKATKEFIILDDEQKAKTITRLSEKMLERISCSVVTAKNDKDTVKRISQAVFRDLCKRFQSPTAVMVAMILENLDFDALLTDSLTQRLKQKKSRLHMFFARFGCVDSHKFSALIRFA